MVTEPNAKLTTEKIFTLFPSYKLFVQALENHNCSAEVTGHIDPQGDYHLSIVVTGHPDNPILDQIIEELKDDEHLTFTMESGASNADHKTA